jgi:CRP-like cAMP-binding protein
MTDTNSGPGPAARDQLRESLKEILRECRPETIDAMVATARIRTVQAGENIYLQGEPVPMTLILEGYGIARRTTSDGQQIFSGVSPSGVLYGYSGIAGS